ncbi:MAG: outer membrane lipoprotein carrier protein LolA [Proteobacteria bacterium]|nr:outer membrane lipoprotein carrier protein LolA [Pseudomonadota bacterium]
MRFWTASRTSGLAAALLLWVQSSGAATGAWTLEALMAELAQSPGVAATFVERKELVLLTEPLESRGRLYFAQPDRLARHISHPGRSWLLISGNQLSLRDESGDQQVDLSSNGVARHFVDNFTVLFRGDLERLKQRYTPRFSSDGERWTLELTPRTRPMKGLIEGVTLRGRDRVLEEMVVVETNGDRTVTAFREVEPERSFSPEEEARFFSLEGWTDP